MKKSFPAFQNYAEKEYAKTRKLSSTAKAAYHDLRLVQWIEGSIPLTEVGRARVCGLSRQTMKKIWQEELESWSKKVDRGGCSFLYIDPDLEAYRESLAKYSEEQRNRGIKGNESRWREPSQVRPENHRKCARTLSPTSSSPYGRGSKDQYQGDEQTVGGDMASVFERVKKLHGKEYGSLNKLAKEYGDEPELLRDALLSTVEQLEKGSEIKNIFPYVRRIIDRLRSDRNAAAFDARVQRERETPEQAKAAMRVVAKGIAQRANGDDDDDEIPPVVRPDGPRLSLDEIKARSPYWPGEK